MVKAKENEKLPEAKLGVLIRRSEERSRARREKTSALMTTGEQAIDTHMKEDDRDSTNGRE